MPRWAWSITSARVGLVRLASSTPEAGPQPLDRVQLGGAGGEALGAQVRRTFGVRLSAFSGTPDAHGLGGNAALTGDLSLAHTGDEQLGRAQPPGLEPVTFSLGHIPQPDTKDPSQPGPRPP
jgi:hypothetical protein